jgi:trk system potassium uptake protein TrkA
VSLVHVIVVGCGRVGAGLARTLEEAGHSVAVVDRKPKAFERLPEDFKGKTVVGVGFDRDRLKAAGIEEASALAAVTNGDNSNILVARVAHETFQVERVVARIYDPRRAKIYERLGIPTIATVEWATERVLQRVLPERATADWVDPSAKVLLIERPVPAAWAGKKVGDLDMRGHARIAVITRLGTGTVAGPDTVLQDGDLLHIAVAGDSLDQFDERLAGTAAAAGGH